MGERREMKVALFFLFLAALTNEGHVPQIPTTILGTQVIPNGPKNTSRLAFLCVRDTFQDLHGLPIKKHFLNLKNKKKQ